MNYKLFFSSLILPLSVISLSLTSCTQPSETTGIGATAGGVLGAGMGAIVGSQTGDAGAGLAVGALAGAVAGAAVGNALQAHEEVMQRQDEALERQQKLIASQQTEIQELRRIGQDNISYKDRVPTSHSSLGAVVLPKSRSGSLNERTITPETVRGSSVWQERQVPTQEDSRNGTTRIEPTVVPSNIQAPTTSSTYSANAHSQPLAQPGLSDDCRKAETEISNAKSQQDISDQLFHYRRALRLCPNNSRYHKELGDLYLSLNRKADADYEFSEAKRLSN